MLSLFVLVCLGLVFANGVCCGDDAYHAIIAKNLSGGLGYASTIQDSSVSFQKKLFDPRIGVGPTIILPASLVIKIVGNTYWAPGLTIVLIWSTLLLAIGFLLNNFPIEKRNLLIFVSSFFYFSLTILAYHFEHWYALFGEIPAALLIILATLISLKDKISRMSLFTTGFVFSLAFQTKQIALLSFVSFCLFLLFHCLFLNNLTIKAKFQKLLQWMIFLSFGFFTPIILIEIWKITALGPSNYINFWKEYWSFFLEKGQNKPQISWIQFVNRLILINKRFGIFLPVYVIIFIISGLELKNDKKIFPIYSSLIIMVFLYSFYWIFFSIGWPRYYLICVMIIIFVLGIPLISGKIGDGKKIFYIFLLISLSLYNIANINIDYPFKNHRLFSPTEYTKSLLSMSNLLSNETKQKPYITQWWGTAADLEYLSDSSLNFTTFRDPNIKLEKPFFLVINTKFLIESDPDFLQLLKRCETENLGQFTYGICSINEVDRKN